MPRSRSRCAVTGPTPHRASTGSVCRKRSTRSGAITVRPSGFFHAEAIFARNLFGATPADAVSAVRSRIAALMPQRDLAPERQPPRVLGHVEVGLVERERLDPRRDRAEDLEDRLRRGAILLEVGPDDRQVRAEPDGARHRHRRAHAERPRLVAGRGDHAAAGGAAADGDRLAAQRGIVALLDRRVEGVHVDVEDAAGHLKSEGRSTGDRRPAEARTPTGPDDNATRGAGVKHWFLGLLIGVLVAQAGGYRGEIDKARALGWRS